MRKITLREIYLAKKNNTGTRKTKQLIERVTDEDLNVLEKLEAWRFDKMHYKTWLKAMSVLKQIPTANSYLEYLRKHYPGVSWQKFFMYVINYNIFHFYLEKNKTYIVWSKNAGELWKVIQKLGD